MLTSQAPGDRNRTRRTDRGWAAILPKQAWKSVMPRNSGDYREDFYGWTIEQSRLLRLGELSAMEADNIAEAIESIGRSDRRELKSRFVLLVAHLLKWPISREPITQLVGDNRRAKTSDRRNPG